MSRPISFHPRQLANGKWYIPIPDTLSETGKRYRRFFDTKAAATPLYEELKARRDNFGDALGSLSPAQIVDARGAFELLADHPKLTLSEAVRGYLVAHKQKNASIPFLELYNLFLQAKAHRTAKYRRELEWMRDRLEPLHATLACDITPRRLESLLRTMTPSVHNACLRYVKAVMNFGLKRSYLQENPVLKLDSIELERREVETFTVREVRALLEAALRHDSVLLPFFIFGFFTGIRPSGELSKLRWSDVDLTDGVVTIRPEVSKTRRRRFVDISENAGAWLKEYGARGGSVTGLVLPVSDIVLRIRRAAIQEKAGVKRWIHQGMRHTFCSCWLAVHHDINKLVLQSGHSDVNTMWESYHRGVKKAEAEKFWAIRPPAADERKIIQLPA
jgi:integrase/recombinase XerD